MVPTVPAYAGPLRAAWTALRSGEVRRANDELARQARSGADLSAEQSALLIALSVEGSLAVGDVGAATGAAELLASYCAGQDRSTQANAHLGLGEMAAATGDHATALTHHTTAGQAHDGGDVIRPWRTGAALALVRLGRRQEATELAQAQVEAAGDPHVLATGLRALAVAQTDNDPIGVLRRALEAAELTLDRRLAAQIGTDLAGLMLLAPASHDASQAVALLRGAESYAAAEGLWPLHGRVVRLLERAGQRPRPLAGEALALLTVAERRVARLAATGRTNRQIAESLEVSIKGVEWHLSRVYRKLGIGSRDGLARLLRADAFAG